MTPSQVFGFDAQPIDARQADRQENRIEAAPQVVERKLAAKRDIGADFDAADREDVPCLALGKVIDRLVGGNSVLVETSRVFRRGSRP